MWELIGYVAFGLYALANVAAIGLWIYAAWLAPSQEAPARRLSGPRSGQREATTSGELLTSHG
jgi:hypothetical protein